MTVSKESYVLDKAAKRAVLTLSKNNVVGLDKVVEGVLLQLDNIGGSGHGGGREKPEGELGRGVHADLFPGCLGRRELAEIWDVERWCLEVVIPKAVSLGVLS